MRNVTAVRYDLAQRKGCHLRDGTAITSFAVRETNGDDEIQAAALARAKGDDGAQMVDEQVRVSLVEVNGEPVAQPYLAYDGWSSRARQFAFKAWKNLNTVDEKKEGEDFDKGGAVVTIAVRGPSSPPSEP